MNQEKIGNFIAATRKENGLTQAQLAEKLGVNNKTVSRWETGKNMPDYAILEDLTFELGITVNELIRGEKIIKEDIVREYDHNLVNVLKEYKRMKRAKNIILSILLVLACITVWLSLMLLVTLGLPYMVSASARIEINDDISQYNEYIGADAREEYRNKCNMDESIFPTQLAADMNVADYKMVYYNPWDPQYLSYLVVDYDEPSWNLELERLKSYPSTEYVGYYGVSGFTDYDLLAIHADDYYGFVYALADQSSQQIIYVEIIFCNYYMDIDYKKICFTDYLGKNAKHSSAFCRNFLLHKEYIPAKYLPDGFDATVENAYRQERLM